MADLTEVVAIRGGGINLESPLGAAWVVKPKIVEGRRLIDIYTKDYRCQQYFENNWKMVHYITKLRNERVKEALRQLAAEDDPNEGNPVLHGMPNRPKREIIDKLPPVLSIPVVTGSGLETSVNVLPSWFERGMLQIELTQETMDLLLEAPAPAESARPFVPRVTEPNVAWVAHRNHVRCHWSGIKNPRILQQDSVALQ